MSIPLDNLYNWVDNCLPGPAILYVFHPHGSKEISNLKWHGNYDTKTRYKLPSVIAHDQEPLDWDFYNNPNHYIQVDLEHDRVKREYCINFNLQSLILEKSGSLYDKVILLHSEKNSADLNKYQQHGFVGAYYWAHAMLSRDWYRFAQHDTRLNATGTFSNLFLIYCRDWSHRREYRLKFLELVLQQELESCSKTSLMHCNSDGVHFTQHNFDNPALALTNADLLYKLPDNTCSSSTSAEYDYQDFVENQISVVLETVFDGDRIHLTEKTLRPIACGHPFLLAAGPGSLEYLRSYGFKTFSPWIDESYDLETDSVKRLEKIVSSMKQIQNLSGKEQQVCLQHLKQIAQYNKELFFSQKFFDTVESELQHNLAQAYSEVQQTRGRHYLEIIRLFKKYNLLDIVEDRKEKVRFLRQLRQSY